MKDILVDIVDHVGSIGSIEAARVVGSAKETVIDAIDADKTVIVTAKLKEASHDFVGEFGIGRFSTLKGLLNFANFKTDDASVQVVRETREGAEQPTEMHFSNASTGTHAGYRFMHAGALPAKAIFKGANWDVVIHPSAAKVQEFSALAAIMASNSTHFVVKTNGTDLVFNVGESDDRASAVFAQDVQGKMTKGWSWPIAQVLQILKLADPTKITMKFSDQGVLQVDMESGLAHWSYILPARMK